MPIDKLGLAGAVAAARTARRHRDAIARADAVLANGIMGWCVRHPRMAVVFHGNYAGYAKAIRSSVSRAEYVRTRYVHGGLMALGGALGTAVEVSRTAASEIRRYYGLRRVAVIENGIVPGSFAGGDGEAARRRHGLPDGPLVLFAGRLEYRKGADVLRRAAAAAARRGDPRRRRPPPAGRARGGEPRPPGPRPDARPVRGRRGLGPADPPRGLELRPDRGPGRRAAAGHLPPGPRRRDARPRARPAPHGGPAPGGPHLRRAPAPAHGGPLAGARRWPRPASATCAATTTRPTWPTATTPCCAAAGPGGAGREGGMTTRSRPATAVRPMHLALIPQKPVLPLDNGSKIRNFHLFRALAARHRVSLLLTEPPDDAGLELLIGAGMDPVCLPKPGWRYLSYLGSLARGAPVYFAAQTNPSVRRWLRAHAGDVDAVMVASIGPTLSLPRGLGRPVLVDTHNVEWARRAERAVGAPGRARPAQAPLRPGNGGLRAPGAAVERARLRLLGGRAPDAARDGHHERGGRPERGRPRRGAADAGARGRLRRSSRATSPTARTSPPPSGSPARSPPPCAAARPGGGSSWPGATPRRSCAGPSPPPGSRCGRRWPTCGRS